MKAPLKQRLTIYWNIFWTKEDFSLNNIWEKHLYHQDDHEMFSSCFFFFLLSPIFQVYLARTEGSSSGRISWKLDFAPAGLKIKSVSIMANSQTFHSGRVCWHSQAEQVTTEFTGGIIEKLITWLNISIIVSPYPSLYKLSLCLTPQMGRCSLFPVCLASQSWL